MKLLFDQNISFRILSKLIINFPEAKQVRELGIENYTDYTNSKHPYRKYRLTYCENVDSRLDYRCTTTIKLSAQLEVDHIDGDPSNNDPENLQTLCSCCHKYKTIMYEDHKSPGRKALGVK